MKKLIFVLILLCTAIAVFAADPVEGYWVSINEEGKLTYLPKRRYFVRRNSCRRRKTARHYCECGKEIVQRFSGQRNRKRNAFNRNTLDLGAYVQIRRTVGKRQYYRPCRR